MTLFLPIRHTGILSKDRGKQNYILHFLLLLILGAEWTDELMTWIRSKSILGRMNVSLKQWFTSDFLYWQPVCCRHTSPESSGTCSIRSLLSVTPVCPSCLSSWWLDTSFNNITAGIDLFPFHCGHVLLSAWNFPLVFSTGLAHFYLQNLF